MTRCLVDTNVISELRKGDQANAGVRDWFASGAPKELWLSVLVIGELRRGVALLVRRDPTAADPLAAWVDTLVANYGDRILPIDVAVGDRWAQLGVPDPMPVIDGLIAATALTHGLTLVTRNEADFARTGVEILNPFT